MNSSAGTRIRQDLLRFGLLHSHRRCSSDTSLSHGGGQLPNYWARGASPCAVRPRPVLSSRGPAAPPKAVGNGAGSDRHGALESTNVGSLLVERKKDGVLGQRVMRLSGIPITVGYRLHGER